MFFHYGRLFHSKRHRRVPSHGSAFCLSPLEKIIPLCWSSHSVNMSFLWLYQLTSTRNVWAQLPNSCSDFANNSAATSNQFFIHLIHLYTLTYSLHVSVDSFQQIHTNIGTFPWVLHTVVLTIFCCSSVLVAAVCSQLYYSLESWLCGLCVKICQS